MVPVHSGETDTSQPWDNAIKDTAACRFPTGIRIQSYYSPQAKPECSSLAGASDGLSEHTFITEKKKIKKKNIS